MSDPKVPGYPFADLPAGEVITRRQLRELERSRPALRRSVRAAPRVRADHSAAGKRRILTAAAPFAVAVTAVSGIALTAFAPPVEAETPAVQAAVPTPVPVVSAPAGGAVNFNRSGMASSFDEETKLSEILVTSGGAVSPAQAKGTLAQPLASINPTSGFGYRVDPLGRGTMMHTGQDFGIACGTDVFASADGTVVEAGYIGYHGNRVVLDHGNGLKTTYNHLASVGVSAGDVVERGNVIASSGTTGNSTGCHLHFEVMVNEAFVDPAGWL